MGVKQFAWIDDDGNVLREQGMLGITLEKTSSREALTGFLSSSSDLTEIASIPLDQNIPRPFELKELRVRLTHADKSLFLDGDRQFYKNDVLTIRKESLVNRAVKNERNIIALKPFLEASPLIQSEHPDIVHQVQRIISPSDSDTVKANKLIQWIYRNIEKRPVLSMPNALDTLRNKVGDCNEHAALLAAMARAAGIPAQIEAGLVYQRGRFYYHAWNVVHLGKWVTADAVFGQLPADVTHIRLVRGSEDKQIDLLGSIGKLQIHIEEYR
jgi:transglutaminase-like putative cysteine protease